MPSKLSDAYNSLFTETMNDFTPNSTLDGSNSEVKQMSNNGNNVDYDCVELMYKVMNNPKCLKMLEIMLNNNSNRRDFFTVNNLNVMIKIGCIVLLIVLIIYVFIQMIFNYSINRPISLNS
jgi:hypothetical protein